MTNNNTLVEAINKADFDHAKLLLDNGASLPGDISDWDREQLYVNIIRGRGYGVLDAMLDKGMINRDVYEYDSFRRSIFEKIFNYLPDDSDALTYLRRFTGKLQNINDEVEGYTLLSLALAEKAKPAIIECLIGAGCDARFRNTAQSNLLTEAIRLNMIPDEQQLAYLEALVKAGADVHEPNVEKKTPLHYAVISDKKHILGYLLEQGANPNDQDWHGNTAYHFAVTHSYESEVLGLLCDHRPPDFEQRNREGETVLATFLRFMSGSEKSICLLEKLMDAGADMEQTSPYYGREKPGWDWALEKPVEVLQMLLKKTGKDVNDQDNDGNTLLHKICATDTNFSHEKARDLYKKTKLLLDTGADVSITNARDETPLMLASADNYKTKLAELLITAGR